MVSGLPGDTLITLIKSVQDVGGHIEAQSETSVELAMGSRASYRLWGVLSTVRMRPVRLLLTVDAVAPDATRVTAHAESDQGSGLYDVTFLTSRHFKTAFARLFGVLREAAPPLSVP